MEIAMRRGRREIKANELLNAAITGKRKASQPLDQDFLAKKTKEKEKVIGLEKQVRRKEGALEKLYDKRDEAVSVLKKLELEDDEGSRA
jgi:hypothetical protein